MSDVAHYKGKRLHIISSCKPQANKSTKNPATLISLVMGKETNQNPDLLQYDPLNVKFSTRNHETFGETK